MKVATVFAVLIFTVAAAFASDIYVDVNSPNNPGSGIESDPFRAIQPAIDIALDGDTIIIAPGTYSGPQNTDINTSGLNITIRSINPNDSATVDTTIIDCAAGDIARRAFLIQTAETDLTIEGLTVKNGNAPILDDLEIAVGGAIAVSNSAKATISKCFFISNNASFGGAIASYLGSTIISDCDFIENSTTPEGNGGAIYALAGDLYITGCSIIDNFSGFKGGAISTDSAALSIDTTAIQNNTALIDGGGIDLLLGDAVISNCLITNNTSVDNGGGINCVSTANTLEITNCTIAANYSEYGGGVALLTSEGIISNSIITENSADYGPQIALREDTKQSSLTVKHCNIQNLLNDVYNRGLLTFGPDNFDTDPMFVSFDPVSDPLTWDFHLKSTSGRYENGTWVKDTKSSPCLDAGPAAAEWTKEPWPNGKRINTGAYANTFQASKSGNIADLNLDGQVNQTDLKYLIETWLDEPAGYEDFNLDGTVNLQDLAKIAENWLQ